MIFISILFLFIGAMLFWVLARKLALSKVGVTACAIYVTMMGLGMLITAILKEDMIFLTIFSMGLGGMLFATAVFSMVKPYFCREKTTGEFRGSVRIGGKAWYAPAFTYIANGKKYNGTSSNIYFDWVVRRKYKPNIAYPIWYSEKNPAIFTERRKLRLMYIWILALSFMFIYLPFYVMYGF